MDELYNRDARFVRREYGNRDARLNGSVDRIALTRAISDLPKGYRTIFLLHELEGYEHQEIAEMLNCSVGTSKSQLHKAKQRIREFLGQAGDDDREGANQASPAGEIGTGLRLLTARLLLRRGRQGLKQKMVSGRA